jgi:FtsZ-binding cell division protein ZapB
MPHTARVLQVEVAELQKKLDSMSSLEKEVESMRKKEDEMKKAKNQGLWGYIAGSDKV